MLRIGDKAPEFTLKDQNSADVSLSDFKGSKVLLYFYPKAMTPGCTVQACSLSQPESLKQYEKLGIKVLAVSKDSPERLKKFEQRDNLKITLLSDPENKVIEQYGAWRLKKLYGKEYMGIFRMSYIVDEDGKIEHILEKVNTKTHHQDVLNLLKGE